MPDHITPFLLWAEGLDWGEAEPYGISEQLEVRTGAQTEVSKQLNIWEQEDTPKEKKGLLKITTAL